MRPLKRATGRQGEGPAKLHLLNVFAHDLPVSQIQVLQRFAHGFATIERAVKYGR
jgi:hypothetical protein